MDRKRKPSSDEIAIDTLAGVEAAIRVAWTEAATTQTDDVVRRVRSGHVADRREAARQLGGVITRNRGATRDAIGALELALRDADAQVRISTLDALEAAAAAGTDISQARRALVGALGDELALVRRSALALLARVGSSSLDLDERAAIARALGDRDVGVRAEAGAALLRATRAGEDLSPWLSTMAAALDDDDAIVRSHVHDALAEIVERDRDDAMRVLGLLVRPTTRGAEAPSSERRRHAIAMASLCRRVIRGSPPATARQIPVAPPVTERTPPVAMPLPRTTWLVSIRRWLARTSYDSLSLAIRTWVFDRPAVEDWRLEGATSGWSSQLLRERLEEVTRWSPPPASNDSELRAVWLFVIESELRARG